MILSGCSYGPFMWAMCTTNTEISTESVDAIRGRPGGLKNLSLSKDQSIQVLTMPGTLEAMKITEVNETLIKGKRLTLPNYVETDQDVELELAEIRKITIRIVSKERIWLPYLPKGCSYI